MKKISLALWIILAGVWCVTTATSFDKHKEINLLREAVIERTKINTAFTDLIYRVWIDNPSYVEDVLTETDEWVHIDNLLEGNWDDTFYFKSDEDSINYRYNWYYEPRVAHTLPHEPDTLPSKPPKDYILLLCRAHRAYNEYVGSLIITL